MLRIVLLGDERGTGRVKSVLAYGPFQITLQVWLRIFVDFPFPWIAVFRNNFLDLRSYRGRAVYSKRQTQLFQLLLEILPLSMRPAGAVNLSATGGKRSLVLIEELFFEFFAFAQS